MRLSVNDAHYNLERHGSGASLVLLHGFTGSAASWSQQIEAVAPQHDVIAVDLLGHGATAAPPDPERYTMEHTFADLAALLDALALDKIDLLGYSMGGRVALAFAATHPQRVRRLILESASPGLGSPDERQARAASDAALADRIERDGLPAFVDYWENIPLFASQKRLPETVQARVRMGRLAASPLGLANSLRGLSTGRQASYWDALPNMSMPTLLIAGALDHKYATIAAQMNMFIRRSTLAIVTDVGHTVHLEAPDDFNQRVLNFLTS